MKPKGGCVTVPASVTAITWPPIVTVAVREAVCWRLGSTVMVKILSPEPVVLERCTQLAVVVASHAHGVVSRIVPAPPLTGQELYARSSRYRQVFAPAGVVASWAEAPGALRTTLRSIVFVA